MVVGQDLGGVLLPVRCKSLACRDFQAEPGLSLGYARARVFRPFGLVARVRGLEARKLLSGEDIQAQLGLSPGLAQAMPGECGKVVDLLGGAALPMRYPTGVSMWKTLWKVVSNARSTKSAAMVAPLWREDGTGLKSLVAHNIQAEPKLSPSSAQAMPGQYRSRYRYREKINTIP